MRLRRGVEHVEREQCIQPPLLVRVGCWWLRHGVTCSAAYSTTHLEENLFTTENPPRSSLRGLQVRGIFPVTKRHFRQISPRRRLSAARSRRRGDALLPGGLQRTDPGQAQNVKQDTARQDGRHRVRHQIKARLKQASSTQPTLPSTRISPLYTVQCTLKSTESHDDSRCCPVYGLRDTFNALALYSKG